MDSRENSGEANFPAEEYHGNGHIGGIIMLNFTKMSNISNRSWNDTLTAGIHEFLARERAFDPEWNPQLNDQDIFNSLFTVRPELVHTIPCEWNLQYHAYQEHQRICGEVANGGLVGDCDESRRMNMFMCRRPPAVVHFMAQSYRTKPTGLSYYLDFYRAMERLPTALLAYDHLRDKMCGLPR